LPHVSLKTVRKWLCRARQQPAAPKTWQLPLVDPPRAPHQPQRKVYFGAIHAALTLQKKYGYAGWFRLKGYLERDYGIYLSPTTFKKIMALKRLKNNSLDSATSVAICYVRSS
jgi:hypothetical protein